MKPTSYGSADIAEAAECSQFKVRHAVKTGKIPRPDILENERAWLWSPQAAETAIATLKPNHRGKRRCNP